MAQTMKALVVQEGKVAKVVDTPIPRLRPDYVKVKVEAVALNPTDWKHIAGISDPGAIVGCDFCGIVEEVGDKVTAKVKKGDRIAGMTHGGNVSNHEDGCFATHCVVKDGIFLHPPSSLPSTSAATLGVGVTTVGQALYQALSLPLPSSSPPEHSPTPSFPLLIYGGATATGALAIQYAKLSGARVVTTASASNHAYLSSLGADQCVEYRGRSEEDVAAEIRAYAPDLHLALDCISSEATARICAAALAAPDADPAEGAVNEGKSIVAFLLNQPSPREKEGVESRRTLGYTAMGEAFVWQRGETVEAKKEDWEFARDFWRLSEGLLASGRVRVHRPDVRGGGLEGVMEGLEEMREGKVSGVKVVYEI